MSEHLKEKEIVCHCCGKGFLTPETYNLFEAIRKACGEVLGEDCPIIVSSGFRCPEHNKAVGGKEHSQHLLGKALDLIQPDKIDFETFYSICLKCNTFGKTIAYPEKHFVHVDTKYISDVNNK